MNMENNEERWNSNEIFGREKSEGRIMKAKWERRKGPGAGVIRRTQRKSGLLLQWISLKRNRKSRLHLFIFKLAVLRHSFILLLLLPVIYIIAITINFYSDRLLFFLLIQITFPTYEIKIQNRSKRSPNSSIERSDDLDAISA